MKDKIFIKLCVIILLAIPFIGSLPKLARADFMYDTYVKDSFNYFISVQPPYKPAGYVGRHIFIDDPKNPGTPIASPMKRPSDVFIDHQDHIYISDTGNNRIVIFNPDGSMNRIIALAESPFKQPQGIFVSSNTGDIYVADTGNKRVVQLNQQGDFLKEFTVPNSPFIPSNYKFDPIKLVVDKRGFLYIATLGGYQGLLQLDPEGDFISFFGSNKIQLSVLGQSINNIKKMIYSEEMLANELSNLPGAIGNVAIDDRGFIYTVSRGGTVKNQQVKKLNIKGSNLIAKSDNYTITNKLFKFGVTQDVRKFGEVVGYQIFSGDNEARKSPQLMDAAIDSYGNIVTIDSNYKNVSFYDTDGNSLFFWTGLGSTSITQLGLQRSPVAVAFNSRNELFILDDQDHALAKYELTSFGSKVFEANAWTAEGHYEESSVLWNEVLRYNSSYPPAINGLARARFQQGNYEEALRLFKLSYNQYEYSNTFWQLRLEWLQRHFSTIATFLLLGGILLWIGLKLFNRSKWKNKWRNRRKSQRPIVIHLKHAFYVMRHPVDGFSDIRYESKGGYGSALILLVLAIITMLFTTFFTSFSFNMVDRETLRLLPILLQFIAIWIIWVVCNYFIGSIMQGEARFKDVFVGSAYALMPMIVFGIPLAIVSNILSITELSIYSFMSSAIWIWTGLMFIWCVQALQNYYVSETIMNILITLFAMIMVAILGFVIYSLTVQFVEFVKSIYREVILR